jgi:hypothetical protein
MELISKEKIENNAGNSYGFNLNWGHRSAFKQGAEFAENELQNLAIEFSDWKDLNCVKQWSSKQGNYWTINGKFEPMYFHNRELFIIFMEQRTK